jgi:tRNA threonylcarbamoyladenosine biosynthesis protein TsaB
MKVLALETATDFAGIGIVDTAQQRGEEVSEFNIPPGKGEKIVNFIDRLLNDNNLKLNDIDLLAAGIGPGLYTGLRCGLSVMKGFSISTGIPLIGVSTLDTIAYNFSGYKEKIAVLLNAYGGEVYGAIYETAKNFKRKGNYFSGGIEDFLRFFNELRSDVVFAGTGLKIYQKKIKEILGRRALFASRKFWIPRPASLAGLAVKRYKKGKLPHPDKILPLYLKKSEAERKWEKYRSHS